MKVKLIARSNGCIEEAGSWSVYEPELVCGSAARSCYSVRPSSELLKTMSQEQMEKTLKHAIQAGHTSVLEHISFSFSVEGVSRVLTHQLVRHRHLSFSQQSMRYVDVHRLWENTVIPRTVQDVIAEEDFYADTETQEPMWVAIKAYKEALSQLMSEMDKHNIPSEDQRYFLPNGVSTNITVTGNARAWIEFCELRCCTRAQKEIRDMACAIRDILKEECPFIFQNLGAHCDSKGYCPEIESCGRKPTLIQIKEGNGSEAE